LSYIFVTRPQELRSLIRQLGDSPWVALDTEFITEKKYQAQLCLVQVAAEGVLGLIDPLMVEDTTPFWEFLCQGEREVLMHAGRSELEFCYRFAGRLPECVFDVQLAAGFIGCDYPCSFGTLLERYLQVTLPKAETRTDWSRRPLTGRQIDYALNDVRYLNALVKKLKKQLSSLKRTRWYQSEIRASLDSLAQDFATPKWRSLPGLNSLSSRELAIVRDLWFWRDSQAKQYNIPGGLVLRDDLIIELARRKSADVKRISAVRGMQRSDLKRHLPYISQAVQRGLDCPDTELPEPSSKQKSPQYAQMVQLLYSGLALLCQQQGIAVNVVATQNDVRDYINVRLKPSQNEKHPVTAKLEKSWRVGIVGRFFDDLLEGKVAIRIDKTNPKSPLQFVEYDAPTTQGDNKTFVLE
jgi:Ribonuclease D